MRKGLSQMGIDPFTSAKLSKVEGDPFLNRPKVVECIENLRLVISANHICKGVVSHDHVRWKVFHTTLRDGNLFAAVCVIR